MRNHLKTNLPKILFGLTIGLLLLCAARKLFADLTVTVQPGYTFAAGETVDRSKLNRLGQPTITISGTVGGTNAGLAAGSVNGTHLADTVAGTNLTWDSSSPRRLVITNGGVNVNQLNTNIIGVGLNGGYNGTTGVRLNVTNVPAPRLTVTSNYVIVGDSNNVGSLVQLGGDLSVTNGVLNLSSNAHLQLSGFTSGEFTLSATTVANTNHGLGATPMLVRWVLVCKSAEIGYEVGDEIDVAGPEGTGAFTFSTGANSTNVFLVIDSFGTTITYLNRTNGASGTLTRANWRAKCYAKP